MSEIKATENSTITILSEEVVQARAHARWENPGMQLFSQKGQARSR